MVIESDNERDGALSGFCSCGLVNRLGGSGASDLDAFLLNNNLVCINYRYVYVFCYTYE